MLDKYSLEGFPSYLFFDRDHKLVHSQTAFPGLDRYRALEHGHSLAVLEMLSWVGSSTGKKSPHSGVGAVGGAYHSKTKLVW